MRIELQRVEFMPKVLEPGILYVAEEYGAAAHLCACGCGTKIRTPITPTEWAIMEGPKGVSVCPSIGNWQRPCRSHYWITDGEIRWSTGWTDEQVEAGRARESARRDKYFAEREAAQKKPGFFRRLWRRWSR
jgi:hypothetical protein